MLSTILVSLGIMFAGGYMLDAQLDSDNDLEILIYKLSKYM